jgi:hypothetical protein
VIFDKQYAKDLLNIHFRGGTQNELVIAEFKSEKDQSFYYQFFRNETNVGTIAPRHRFLDLKTYSEGDDLNALINR